MHDEAACEVAHTLFEQPAARSPDPMAHRRIDEQHPRRREQQHETEPCALRIGADDQRWRDDREGHLEHEEYGLGDRAGLALGGDAIEEGLVEPTPETIGRSAITERNRVTHEVPQQRHQAGDGHALAEHREHVLRLHKAAIEQRQRRQGHQQHERSGGEDPGGVARIGLGKGGGRGEKRKHKASGRSAAGSEDGHGGLRFHRLARRCLLIRRAAGKLTGQAGVACGRAFERPIIERNWSHMPKDQSEKGAGEA